MSNPYIRDLSLAPEHLRDDFDTVYDAVYYNGFNLEHASLRLQDDPDIVSTAVIDASDAIRFASTRMQEIIRQENTDGNQRTRRVDAVSNAQRLFFDDDSNFNSMRRNAAALRAECADSLEGDVNYNSSEDEYVDSSEDEGESHGWSAPRI